MHRTIALLLLVSLIVFALGCKEPKQLTISDIHLPDPEGELAKHLGILAVVELGRCEYFDEPLKEYDHRSDTAFISVYDTNGSIVDEIDYSYVRKAVSYHYNELGLLEVMVRPVGDGSLYFCYDLYPDSNLLVRTICPNDPDDRTCTSVNCRVERSVLNSQGQIDEQVLIDRQGTQYYYDSLGRLTDKVVYDLPKYHQVSIQRFNKAFINYYTWVTTTRYYYRGTGVLLDSIVQHVYDNKGNDLHGGYTQYYDHKAYPILKRYEEIGNVHILSCLLHNEPNVDTFKQANYLR